MISNKFMKLSSSLIPLLSVLLCFSDDVKAQSSPSGAVRISIISGGSVPFVINSLDKWENGATLPNWTTIRISVTDSVAGVGGLTDWELRFNAQDVDVDSEFDAEDPANASKITLNTLELSLSLLSGSCGAVLGASPVALSNAEETLVTGTMVDGATCVDNILNITYDCGSSLTVLNNGFMDQGAEADYYTEIMFFTLYGCIGGCP